MSAPQHKPPLVLDMDFDEALHRFSKVKPEDLPDDKRAKKKEDKTKKRKAD